MKKIITLLLICLPITLFAQELIGKKKKYISSIKQSSSLIVDLPEMSIWSNQAEAGSLFLICYFRDEKCEKTVSIYPNEKLKQWEKILNTNCAKVKGEELVWLDQRRQLLFKVVPCENQTFALESTKANVQ
ncbi:hypothetical protein AAE02nite_07900 [Adhaeribacter aerolatus]|uniref:Uncharacterized protein n=1 Tax=Adhaeribacter aerolatus TaxID=670289 RepID=A0A512ATS8_9BACT|nr:hypothetical protein [Adhaeribacter aerolatus]GEO03126.1 hypothetical protein AAE02nite_07900 [Adhaeribacter aerolatus]